MRTAATTPILLVRPPSPEAFPHPPTTLSGLMAFVSAIGRAPTNAMVIPGNGNRQADMLLTMMTRAAAEYGAALCVSQHVFHPASLQALMDALQTRPNQLRLSLSCRMDNSADEQLFVPNRVESIVQVLWRTTRRLPDLGFFKAVSRAGIWNHLILDGPAATAANRDAIARQPNIVHSWQANVGNGQDTAADDGYGGLRPLPGRPLWQILTDPIHCLVLIDRFGKNWLLRSRADNQGDRILTLGETMSTHFCPQDQLPGGYLDEICAMVAAGGTVATTHVRSNLKRAYLIGYVSENGIIVGNSSLKHPRPQYIENVRRQSGLDLTGFVERGYTSVRPEYRGLGIGTRLLEGLTARAGDRKIFSVIAEDNEATKIIARRNRTRKVASYHSEKAGKPVGIWMPEWMIDDHEKNDPETGIRIGIITVRDDAYHPNRRLLEAADQAGCQGILIHPYRTWPTTVDGQLGWIGAHADRPPQVVLPRQGAEIGASALALIHHIQCMGIPLVNDFAAVCLARNKFLSQQALAAAGLPCPATVFVNEATGFASAVDRLGGYPVVAKPVSARQGEGVMLIEDARDAHRRVLAGLDRRRGVMVQRYIAPDRRRDIRVLVIGGEAVCAACLTPRQGDFRANFHLGGDIRCIALSAELADPAVTAAATVGCDVAGVDMMVENGGRPLIVEVNYSPGFRGMETASRLDIAGRIIDLAIGHHQKIA